MLDLDLPESDQPVLSRCEVLASMTYLLNLVQAEPGYRLDDQDHFANRRIRSVGELIQNQVRIGLSRMERVVRERMTTQDVEAITPQTLINIRPVVAAIKEFFVAAVAVHGPGEPAVGPDAPAPSLRARPRWPVARASRLRGPRRPLLPLRPHVPDRDAGGPEHRPHRRARHVRQGKRVRVHPVAVPKGRRRPGHRRGRLPHGRRGGGLRRRAGQRQARRQGSSTSASSSGSRRRRPPSASSS